MSFTIEKNRHIFACWAASRAAGVSPLCKFKVENGKGVLDRIFEQDGQKALDDTSLLVLEIDMDDPSLQMGMMKGVYMKEGKTIKDLMRRNGRHMRE